METEEIKTVLTAEDRGYTKTLQKAEDALKKIEAQEKKVTESTEHMAVALTKADKAWVVANVAADTMLAALTVLNEGARKMFEIFDKNFPSLYKTVQTAQRLGVSAKFVEGYSMAAKKAGISSQLYEKALTGVSTALGKAEGGNKKAVIAFNDLHLSWKKIAELDPETRFKTIAEAVSKLPHERQLAAINNLLQAGGVGGSARSKLTQQLAPMFKDGADGINKMVEAGDRFGASWDEHLEKAVKRTGDLKIELNEALETAEKKLTAGLAPAMGDIYKSFTDWLEKANKMGDIQKFAESIGAALKSAAGWAKSTMEFVDKIITGNTTTGRAAVAAAGDAAKNTTIDNKTTTRLMRAQDSTNGIIRNMTGTRDLIGLSTDDLKKVAEGTYGGGYAPPARNYRKLQAEALLTLQGKYGISREALGQAGASADWISVLGDETTRRQTKQNEELMKRAGVQQYKYGASTPEHFAGGTEAVPLSEAQQRQLARDEERKKKEAERLKKKAENDAIRWENKKKALEERDYQGKRRVESAQERVMDIADRKARLQKEIAGDEAKKDRTFHGAQAGTVEAYRARLAYQKADPTSLRQLEEQKKIAKEEEKANKNLEEAKRVLGNIEKTLSDHLKSPTSQATSLFGNK